MATNNNPNKGQAAIPDNARDASASPLPVPPMSVPPEPGTGRLDEDATWDKDTHPWPDVPTGRGVDRPTLNMTPGLAPGDETHQALKEQLTPDVARFTAQPNTQGGAEPMDGYIIPADGKKENMSPAKWGGPWTKNASEEENA